MNQRILILICAALALTPMQTIFSAEIGSKAPDCALTSINDTQRYDLQQFHGKVLYVDFWASWCPPCAKSFSFLNDLERDLKDSGLQVIGINLDQAPEDARTFLDKYPANFTVVADANEKCARDFDVKAMPSSYLVDRNGVIRHVHWGFRPGEAKEIRVLTEQLLTEKPGQK
ncbi:MAG: TlpA disulfide reductase family protein [Methylococcales bacterium]|nr:TlpA disulfide reductase family protein [Methylococcales bacterium]